jgi:osmotically-inducible protein OsmY
MVLLVSGCKARDADILAQVGRKARQKVEASLGATTPHLAGNLPMGEASVAVRVQNRIHWDRYLRDLDVQVLAPSAGTVTLHGHVSDLALKQRILDLAKSTVGVKEVEDKLVLPEEK